MAKYDGIVGQEVLSVEDEDNGITIVFRDNRFLFVKVIDGARLFGGRRVTRPGEANARPSGKISRKRRVSRARIHLAYRARHHWCRGCIDSRSGGLPRMDGAADS